MNRGRVQAQGKKLEKSEKWAQNEDFYKEDGIEYVENLKNRLSTKELYVREKGFEQCERFINQAAMNNGIRIVDMKKPFIKSFPKNHKERVDLEVHEGIAFTNKPTILNSDEK